MCKRSSFISYIKYIICLMLNSMLPWHTQRSYKLSDTTPGGGCGPHAGEMISRRGLASPGGASLGSDYVLASQHRLRQLSSIHKMGSFSWRLLHLSQTKQTSSFVTLSQDPFVFPRGGRAPSPSWPPWPNSKCQFLSTTGSFPKLEF